jgi:translation initiation factor IF-2
VAKKAAATRVFQIAKELGVDSKDIVAKCIAEEIPGIENHMSVVSVGLSATIREWFSEGQGSVATAVETAAAVDVTKARAKARKRPAKKGSEPAPPPPDDVAAEAPADAVVAPAKPAVPSAPPEPSAAPEDEGPAKPKRAAARVKPIEPPSDDEHQIPMTAPQAPARAAAHAPPAAPSAPAGPAPVMNVPTRPDIVSPVGPMLSQPKKSELKGPRLIRVEKPEVIPAPRARGVSSPSSPRGGPRAGRGVGGSAGDSGDAAGSGRDRAGGGAAGGAGARGRNKRRTATASEEGAGRVGRSGHHASSEDDRSFNWREQDLRERENRLNRAGGFFKAARRDNLKRQTGGGQRAIMAAEGGGKVKVQVPITIKDLSAATGVKVPDIIRKLFMSGKAVTINSVLDVETAIEAVIDYNIELEIDEQRTAEQKVSDQFKDRTVVDERRRSPVVTILGHVDHGKTSLLDKIRNANVAAGEAGGITQATSAFRVPVHVGDDQRMVTFIDTPGHEAFTEMRARGAKVTDIVVLVVAADDGVMPQTVESINHAKAAGVPIVVALNKIDKPEATDPNIHRILGQLAEHELNPVEWGGTTEIVRTSATKGTGIQEILEVLDYQAQLLELKADYGGEAEGTVLEAAMQEGRGPVANVLVQQGTLNKGDFVVVGRAFGRVRDLVDDHGARVDSATPSMPIAFSGLNDMPDAGDKFYVVKSLKNAEEAAAERIVHERQRELAKEKITLDNVFKHLEATGKKELSLIVKGDVQGSIETLRTVLGRISTDEVTIAMKHAAVGGVNESDVTLAETTGAIIVAFNVTSSTAARKAAEARGVDIRFYDVIYDLTDDVKSAAEGLLDPELKLEVLGHADVREVFKISKVGMIAGCYVTDGVIERNSQIRVTRGGIVVEKDRRLESLKRFKDDVKEVRAGQECGMSIEGYTDIKSGDVLECYKTREVKRKL